jgi:hypothetical protein
MFQFHSRLKLVRGRSKSAESDGAQDAGKARDGHDVEGGLPTPGVLEGESSDRPGGRGVESLEQSLCLLHLSIRCRTSLKSPRPCNVFFYSW